MPEVAWYATPPDARLDWNGTDGFLYFKSPENGENHCIPVTTGPGNDRTETRGPTWKIDTRITNGNILTVSPSIHYVGHFHSPNPVQFRLTEINRRG